MIKSGHLRPLAILCLLTFVLAACVTAPATPVAPARATAPAVSEPAGAPAAGSLEGTFWILALYTDASGQMVSVPEGSRANIEFSSGQVTGNAACNLYNGVYKQAGESLTIELAARSAIACAEPIMAQEDAYLAALEQAAGQRVTGNKLDILNADGAVILSFVTDAPAAPAEAAPAAAAPAAEEAASPLAAMEWQVTEYNNGRDGLVPIMAGTAITMTFGADGHMGGTAGCNGFGAPYALDGDRLTIDSIFSTMMFCTEPEGILDQEADFLAALAKTAAYTIADGQLALAAEDGSPVLTAVGTVVGVAAEPEAAEPEIAEPEPVEPEVAGEVEAEPAPEETPAEAPVELAPVTAPTDAALTGQVWQWQKTTLADGSAVTVGAPQRYAVEFMGDGIVMGRADCNRIGGIYTAQDAALNINIGVLTRMACPPGSLSGQFVQMLNSAATYQFEGDSLVIQLRDGAGAIFLARAQ